MEEKDKKQQFTGDYVGIKIQFGDTIDNRGGTIIKEIQHYHDMRGSGSSKSEVEPEYAEFEEVKEEDAKAHLDKTSNSSTAIPNVFMSKKADLLHRKLMKAELLDDDWQPINLSNPKKALLAHMIAEDLNIANVWNTFEPLWDVKLLRQNYQVALKSNYFATFTKDYNEALK